MDLDVDDDSMQDFVDNGSDASDAYSPEPKPKAKAAAKKTAAAKPAAAKAPKAAKAAAPKKLTQTKLAVTKKRPKADSEDEGDLEDGDLSHTPPSAKKQKKAAPAKKSAGKPLAEIENDSVIFDGAPEPKAKAASKKKTASETYQKITQLEHILKRPDTYIGSVEPAPQKMWIFNKETSLMENRTVTFVPGLYKIFDEILVNAADNRQRDKTMTYIKVTVDRAAGEITVENNGKGIPIEMHSKENVYIPELIFGHLLTGSNYDDNEKKTVGGRNGYGAKLTNIFSTEFTLECQDSTNGKHYKQTWTDNMTKCGKAKITSNSRSDFVRVTFKPDFSRFHMDNGIDDDLEALIYRRVYDMAGTVAGVKVHLNGERLVVDFKKYCEMYAKAIANERGDAGTDDQQPPVADVLFEDPKAHRRWQVGFTVSDGSFQQVSFVNSIATTSGGTHVNHIADQICDALLKDLNKKRKGHSLKASHIRNHIFVFVNALIENPAFTSQTKEQMTTREKAFGETCVLTDKFLKKIKETEAINNIITFADKKADKMLAKTDGSKRSRISDPKLIDANLAGTKHGHECTLVLTEGDSARGLAVAGRAILDPDRIGVFPLRGKMLNVRDASVDQILKNKEIQNIKQFLGLKHKTTYKDTKGLRYGHLMIMADQDHDGSHIKGLLINFLQVQFPSLLQIPDFFQEFITPIVKVWQGPNPKKPLRLKTFFNMPQYEEWKQAHAQEIRRWKYKYLKGLGSSTNEDAQVYFTNLDEHLKEFQIMKKEEEPLFDLAFSKKKADDRKEWLGGFVPGTFLDHSTRSISYHDFVHKELILFSMADNIRSIPSMIDGFKPGQRKVIFACFKQNLVNDKKVVELAGYVSEKAAYHHGEASLQQTIIGLAQNFVGSNNVNCLEPSGNFGSRLAGGSDAASARYIHTRLSPFARRVFSEKDEPILESQVDDGVVIEPKVYAPVIPMVLVNGADGIGTGWSTSIPNFHPEEIIQNLKRRMGRLDSEIEEPFAPMTPWFRGWKGTPEPDNTGRFKFNGIAFQDDKNPNEIVVTELPIRMWTDDFKARLEEIIKAEKGPSFIKDYKEFNDHKNVHFQIQMDEKHVEAALKMGLLEKFKLLKSIPLTNLVAFNTQGQIRKYEKVEDILEEFYQYRLKMYAERKKHWLKVYDSECRKLKNQYRFVLEIIEGKLVVSKKKKAVLVKELRDRKYEAFPPKDDGKKANQEDAENDNDQQADDDEDEGQGTAKDYDYLLSMAIWSLTQERLEKLKKQIDAKQAEYDDLEIKSEKDLWCTDLDAFVDEWNTQLKLDEEIQTNIRRMGRRASKKIGAGKGRKARAADDDYSPVKKTARAPKTAPKVAPVVAKVEKVENKTVDRFGSKFMPTQKQKPAIVSRNSYDGAEDFSDEDFAALSRPKTGGAKKTSSTAPPAADSPAEPAAEPADDPPTPPARSKRAAAAKAKKWVVDSDSESDNDDKMLDDVGAMVKGISDPEPAASASADDPPTPAARSKRAAAAKAKTWVVDSESESDYDDKLLGDVGAMVKGIGNPDADASKSGRLSLFAMSRPESSGDNGSSSQAAFSKLKTKPSRTFDLDGLDDTNYEMLARSSPVKSVKDDVDDFLSDDDLPPVSKVSTSAKASSSAAATQKAPLSVVPAKKVRGRPAGAKNKAGESSAAAAKPKPKPKPAVSTALSPAAKAYAAKRKAKQTVPSDDEDEDDEVVPVGRGRGSKVVDEDDDDELMDDAPPPPPTRRGRPARAATVSKAKKPIYIDDDDDEDDSLAIQDDDDNESDEFGMDSD